MEESKATIQDFSGIRKAAASIISTSDISQMQELKGQCNVLQSEAKATLELNIGILLLEKAESIIFSLRPVYGADGELGIIFPMYGPEDPQTTIAIVESGDNSPEVVAAYKILGACLQTGITLALLSISEKNKVLDYSKAREKTIEKITLFLADINLCVQCPNNLNKYIIEMILGSAYLELFKIFEPDRYEHFKSQIIRIHNEMKLIVKNKTPGQKLDRLLTPSINEVKRLLQERDAEASILMLEFTIEAIQGNIMSPIEKKIKESIMGDPPVLLENPHSHLATINNYRPKVILPDKRCIPVDNITSSMSGTDGYKNKNIKIKGLPTPVDLFFVDDEGLIKKGDMIDSYDQATIAALGSIAHTAVKGSGTKTNKPKITSDIIISGISIKDIHRVATGTTQSHTKSITDKAIKERLRALNKLSHYRLSFPVNDFLREALPHTYGNKKEVSEPALNIIRLYTEEGSKDLKIDYMVPLPFLYAYEQGHISKISPAYLKAGRIGKSEDITGRQDRRAQAINYYIIERVERMNRAKDISTKIILNNDMLRAIGEYKGIQLTPKIIRTIRDICEGVLIGIQPDTEKFKMIEREDYPLNKMTIKNSNDWPLIRGYKPIKRGEKGNKIIGFEIFF